MNIKQPLSNPKMNAKMFLVGSTTLVQISLVLQDPKGWAFGPKKSRFNAGFLFVYVSLLKEGFI